MARRNAFTLIELLVVIGIIAILAAILFPVFAQAKNAAKKSVCLSNMKQVAMATIAYSKDFDESTPLGVITSPGGPYSCSLNGLDVPDNICFYDPMGQQNAYVKNYDLYSDTVLPTKYAFNSIVYPMSFGAFADPGATILLSDDPVQSPQGCWYGGAWNPCTHFTTYAYPSSAASGPACATCVVQSSGWIWNPPVGPVHQFADSHFPTTTTMVRLATSGTIDPSDLADGGWTMAIYSQQWFPSGNVLLPGAPPTTLTAGNGLITPPTTLFDMASGLGSTVVFDADGHPSLGPGAPATSTDSEGVHNGFNNFGFADGHAKSMTLGATLKLINDSPGSLSTPWDPTGGNASP